MPGHILPETDLWPDSERAVSVSFLLLQTSSLHHQIGCYQYQADQADDGQGYYVDPACLTYLKSCHRRTYQRYADKHHSKDLDQAAVLKICGGFSLGWTVARNKTPSVSSPVPTSIYNVTNNYIDYDYNVINQNPTIFNVYNGGGNSGTIVNSFDVMSISAASPALIQAGS